MEERDGRERVRGRERNETGEEERNGLRGNEWRMIGWKGDANHALSEMLLSKLDQYISCKTVASTLCFSLEA